MRLIDTDRLMEDFRNTITEQSDTLDWLNMISSQPTAYDVDKVVERLKEMRDISTHNIALNSQENDIDAEILREISHYRRIIQIVKSGGIDVR